MYNYGNEPKNTLEGNMTLNTYLIKSIPMYCITVLVLQIETYYEFSSISDNTNPTQYMASSCITRFPCSTICMIHHYWLTHSAVNVIHV